MASAVLASSALPTPRLMSASAPGTSDAGTSLVTPSAADASLPPTSGMDAAILEVLLAEMPRTLRASAAAASARVAHHTEQLYEAGFHHPSMDEQPDLESQTLARIDKIGAHVGANYAERLCALRPPMNNVLEILKFLCKDMWIDLWTRQVDNLRTNHRGVYALQVNHFAPLKHLGVSSGARFTRAARPLLAWSGGIVRGSLGRLGVPATVSVDVLPLPPPAVAEPAPLGENKFLPSVLFNVKTFPSHPASMAGGTTTARSSVASGRPEAASVAS